MARLALLTCSNMPEPDVDEDVTLAALRAAGHEAELLAWNAASTPVERFDLCILRSTWDYIWHVEAFERFLEEVTASSRLLNPLPVVRWNLHKRYLCELAEAGLRVIPTQLVARGADAGADAAWRAWGDVVVKPAVSAASVDTRRFRSGELDEAEAFLARLTRHRDALVQPYVSTVERGGEKAFVCIDGRLTHGIVKRPRFSGEEERVGEAFEPSAQAYAFVANALACLPEPLGQDLLYARVDAFDDGRGGLMLSELELIEPSLFFQQHPPALAAFVAAIERRVARP